MANSVSKHANATSFKPGHSMSVGQPGPWAAQRQMTQVVISQLHECDPNNRSRMHRIVDKLLTLAEGYELKVYKTVKTKTGNKRVVDKIVEVPADLLAIREIFDRVEGKPKQSVDVKSNGNTTFTMILGEMTPQEAAEHYAETLKVVGDDTKSE